MPSSIPEGDFNLMNVMLQEKKLKSVDTLLKNHLKYFYSRIESMQINRQDLSLFSLTASFKQFFNSVIRFMKRMTCQNQPLSCMHLYEPI